MRDPRAGERVLHGGGGVQAVSRACWLTVGQQFDLNHACRAVTEAFGHPPMLVGSVLTRADFRDVDVRSIVANEDFDRMFGDGALLPLLNRAVSEWLSARTGLPVDYQVQRMSEANAAFEGLRSAIGAVTATGRAA